MWLLPVLLGCLASTPALAVKKALHQTELDNQLLQATLRADLPAAKALIEQGARVNTPAAHDDTNLHRAVRAGHLELVKLLLEKGAHLHAQTEGGFTPLHFAALWGRKEIAALLLKDERVDLRTAAANGLLPLHSAVRQGHEETVRNLLDDGAELEATDPRGQRPLHWAARETLPGMVKLLLEEGAEVSPVTLKGGPLNVADTPLHWSAFYGDMTSVETLVDKQAALNQKNQDNATPLYKAVNHPLVRWWLIKKGATE